MEPKRCVTEARARRDLVPRPAGLSECSFHIMSPNRRTSGATDENKTAISVGFDFPRATRLRSDIVGWILKVEREHPLGFDPNIDAAVQEFLPV
jgi:hypothetical protein